MPTLTLPKSTPFRSGLWRVVVATFAGALGGFAFPTANLWPAIFVSTALLLIAIHGLKFWQGFGVGFLGGIAFYVSGINWISLYLGPEPLVALSILESFFFGLGAAFCSTVWAFLEKSKPTSSLFLQTLSLAAIMTAREWLSTHLPYGGFPWLRFSQALADSPLNRWAWFGGLGWLSFVAAIIASAGAVAWIQRKKLSTKGWLILAAPPMLGILLPLAIQPGTAAEAGTLRIAAIQGNAKAGLFSNERWGSILENHISQTRKLMRTSAGKSVELVIWPENAADISPLDYPQAANKINQLVSDIDKPLLFGTLRNDTDRTYNSSVLWLPGKGPVAIYDKKRPVPFAEYVPDRNFWHGLAPSLIDLVPRGFSFGTRSGVFNFQSAKLGILICFEIAIDEINQGLASQGAEVIVSQTNNADFGHSAQTYQQASLARLQAISTGRAVVNISTVGVSAIYLPDGSIRLQIPTFTAASIVATVPLRTSMTPAHWLGVYLELAVNVMALALCLLALQKTWTSRRKNAR